MRRAILPLMFLCILSGAALGGPSEDIAKRVAEEFNAAPRGVRGDHLLLTMSYLEWDGRSYGYHLPARFQRLAREEETFRIRKLKKRDRAYRIEVESSSGARIKLWLYDRADELSQSLLDEVFPLMLADLFEFREAPDTPRVVVNTASGLAHLGACNHLPPPDVRQVVATAAGHPLCPACFPEDPTLPYDAYARIRADAVERARLYAQAFPPVADPELQQRVQELGERLVASLPFVPRGFEYEFTVVQSGLMQAVSYPTGFVFVTEKLLAATEDEGELAHVLAHEIAHCELNLPPAPQPAPLTVAPVAVFEERYRARRQREQAADVVGASAVAAIYGEERALSCATAVLSKLQFANEAMPVAEAERWDTHPTLAERMWLFEPGRFLIVPFRQFFEARDDEGDVLYRVRVLGGTRLGDDDQRLFVLVDATDTPNKTMKIKGAERANVEIGELKTASGKGKYVYNQIAELHVAPAEAVVVTLTVGWSKSEDFGISTGTRSYPIDPADLGMIKFFDAPDVDKWVRMVIDPN